MAVNSVSQTFLRQDLSIDTKELDGSKETFISYTDAESFGSIGEPSVPAKTFRFSVPYNAVNIRLTYSLTKECDIRLTSPVHYNVNDTDGETEFFKGDKFPIENAIIDNIGYIDGLNKIVTISICPVSLNLNENSLTFYSNINASLSWDICNDFSKEKIKPIASRANNKIEKAYKLPNLINPEEIDKNKPVLLKKTSVNLQDWAEYIIVCPKAFSKDLERLAAYRRLKGYTTKVCAIEDILADPKYINGDTISGINDEAGKLRAFLADAYVNRGTRYVLLAGKYPAMPIRYGYSYDTFNFPDHKIPSDLYFADLNSSWNTTNSGFYGMKVDNLDYHSEIAIGRIPFTNVSEIHDFIDKLKIYEHNPGLGDSDYLSRAFITRQDNGLMSGMSQPYFSEQWFSSLKDIYNGNNLREIISTDDYPTGQDVINELNATNYDFWSFVGHGSPFGVAVRRIGLYDVNAVLGIENQFGTTIVETGNGLNNLTNKNYPSWSYSISCTTMPYDSSLENTSGLHGFNVSKNFGESYILGKEYGGVAYFGHTRASYCGDGEKLLSRAFEALKSMYEDHLGEDGPEFPVTAGDLMTKLRITNHIHHEGRLSHNLFGDPLTTLWISKPNKISYNEIDSLKNHFLLNPNGLKLQYKSVFQLLYDGLYTGRGLGGGVNKEIQLGANVLCSYEYQNSLPVILPLFLQNIKFRKNAYLVTGDVNCGRLVNNEIQAGIVELEDSVTLIIESLGDVHISQGTVLEPNSKLIIKADGNVYLSNIIIPANRTLIIDAYKIFKNGVSIHMGANVQLNERNPYHLAAKRSISENHKPMLVEGRTWWYTQRHRLYGKDGLIAENGISVGEEVEIDGLKWHKIDVVSTGISRNSEWTYNTEPRTIAYMREDGDKIYTAYFDDCRWDIEAVGNFSHEFYYGEQFPTQLTYEYKNIGESYLMGNEEMIGDEQYPYEKIMIKEIVQIENSGFDYNLYKCDEFYGRGLCFIDGLGSILGGFFFDPLCGGCTSMDSYDFPELRYVTEADGSVIYEGIGGYKLWEATGIGNIAVEDNDCYRWYNLQGMEIDEPTAPGIYIRSNSKGNEKIAIQ